MVVTHRLSGCLDTQATFRQRFTRDRFLFVVNHGRRVVTKSRDSLRRCYAGVITVEKFRLGSRRERFRRERVLSRVVVARNSLSEKMATLKASDPQTALQRGFALVYRDDVLVQSIGAVREHGRIRVHLADGVLVSEITAKESNHE